MMIHICLAWWLWKTWNEMWWNSASVSGHFVVNLINESRCVHVQVRKLWSLRCESRQQNMSPWAFRLFYLLPPASCLHAVWQKAGGDVSFSSAALAGDRVSFGDPAARPHPWKKVLLAGKMAAAVKRSLSTGKSHPQLHMFFSRRVSAGNKFSTVSLAVSSWFRLWGAGAHPSACLLYYLVASFWTALQAMACQLCILHINT